MPFAIIRIHRNSLLAVDIGNAPDDQLVNYYNIVIYCRLMVWFSNKSWWDQASLKSLRPGDAYMRQRTMSASAQMTWGLNGTKPLSELTRTTRTPAFWGYPPPPHDNPYYWPVHFESQVHTIDQFISYPKSKQGESQKISEKLYLKILLVT